MQNTALVGNQGGREPLLKTCVVSGGARDPGKFPVPSDAPENASWQVCVYVCVCERERESNSMGLSSLHR